MIPLLQELGLERHSGIWPPDWSQFLPDILSGLIVSVPVGIGVGVALWRWQKNSEDQRMRRAAHAEWRLARPIVASAVQRTIDRTYRAHSLTEFVKVFDPVLEDALKLHVGEWADSAPDDAELTAMAALQVDGITLQRLASSLMDDMKRKLVELGLVGENHTGKFVEWASAWVLEHPDPGSYVADVYDQHRIPTVQMLNDSEVAVAVDAFRKKLLAVEKHYSQLRKSLLR